MVIVVVAGNVAPTRVVWTMRPGLGAAESTFGLAVDQGLPSGLLPAAMTTCAGMLAAMKAACFIGESAKASSACSMASWASSSSAASRAIWAPGVSSPASCWSTSCSRPSLRRDGLPASAAPRSGTVCSITAAGMPMATLLAASWPSHAASAPEDWDTEALTTAGTAAMTGPSGGQARLAALLPAARRQLPGGETLLPCPLGSSG